MINLNIETVKELILRSEPDFLSQRELEINGYGTLKYLSTNEDVWVWNKERVRSLDEAEVSYVVLKTVE